MNPLTISPHTYFIGKNKKGYLLGHTFHIHLNPSQFEGVTILKVLKTDDYDIAGRIYLEFLDENAVYDYSDERTYDTPLDKRIYNEPLCKIDMVINLEDWNAAVDNGSIRNEDGTGYWVKNKLSSDSEVFSTPPLDATHVIWFNN